MDAEKWLVVSKGEGSAQEQEVGRGVVEPLYCIFDKI